MSEGRVHELIARTRSGSGSAAPGEPLLAKYNGMADPPGAEELGSELAGRLREIGPTAVVVWEEAEDVVLGHVVARELGVPMIRAYDADGLVGTNGELPPNARVALVADAIRDPRVVLAAAALARRDGGSVVATAVLLGSEALAAVEPDAGAIIALVPVREPAAADAGAPG